MKHRLFRVALVILQGVDVLVDRKVWISAVLSAIIFVVMFGKSEEINIDKFGFEFIPQSFMVALMAVTMPILPLRKHLGIGVMSIALRALRIALISTAICGGSGYAMGMVLMGHTVPPGIAVSIKAIYGGGLGAVITLLALRGAGAIMPIL